MALELNVGDAMTRDVIKVESTTKIDDALQLMTDRRIRHLPVMTDGRLVGVISIGDLVTWKIAETEATCPLSIRGQPPYSLGFWDWPAGSRDKLPSFSCSFVMNSCIRGLPHPGGGGTSPPPLTRPSGFRRGAR